MELAQVNVAMMRAGLNDPVMAGFVQAYDAIARLAEASPGFVWRLRSSRGHEPVLCEPGGGTTDPSGLMVMNVSVWRSYVCLHQFTYRSAHGALLRHRATWFQPTRQPSTALWWIEAGTHPTCEQAFRRLQYLRHHGASPQAFSLLKQFDQTGNPIRRSSNPSRSSRRGT